LVSDKTPATGFHNSRPPTTTDSSAVTNVHKNPGTLRAENIATSPITPLNTNSQPT
jgi:hypothetical protein